MTNIQTITMATGSNYNLTLNAATVASGGSLTLDASTLASINTATLNAAAIGSGRTMSFLCGAGNDVLSGGGGTNTFYGGAGADTMNAGTGTSSFLYRTAANSPFVAGAGGLPNDVINGFLAGLDKIDLRSLLLPAAEKSVVDKGVVGSFTDTASAGYFGTSGVAVEYSAGNTAQVFVDGSKDGSLGGGDMMIQINGVAAHSLTAANFLM